MKYLILINTVFFILTLCSIGFLFFKFNEKSIFFQKENHLITRSIETTSQILMGMGQRIIALESQIKKVTRRQEELEQSQRKQGLEQAYHHAKKLFELGVDVNEVASHCNIPFAEADLIFKLSNHHHSKQI